MHAYGFGELDASATNIDGGRFANVPSSNRAADEEDYEGGSENGDSDDSDDDDVERELESLVAYPAPLSFVPPSDTTGLRSSARRAAPTAGGSAPPPSPPGAASARASSLEEYANDLATMYQSLLKIETLGRQRGSIILGE